MKISTKTLFLCVIISFSHAIISARKIKKKSNTRIFESFDKEKAKSFAVGAVTQFVGVDSACLGIKLEKEKLELPAKLYEEGGLEGLIASIMIIRQQTYNFFNDKFEEWSEARRLRVCKVFSNVLGKKIDFFDRKVQKYQDKIAVFKKFRDDAYLSYELMVPLLNDVTNPALSEAREEEITNIMQTELQKMNEDVKQILLQFSNQGFKDYVKIETINDLQSNFVDVSKYGELQDLCPQPTGLWDKTKELVKKLYTMYKTS